jgi:CRISPR-associated protein Csd2
MLNSLKENPEAIVAKRYEIAFIYDVKDGNPNGDPDGDNMPRLDPETGHGLITDVCLKRKVRNFVALTKPTEETFEIYVKERGILANEQRRAFKAIDEDAGDTPNLRARAWMCKNFFDVRTFGAVMSTGKSEDVDDAAAEKGGKPKDAGAKGKRQKLWNCGQVRGPVQFSFGRSIDPIQPLTHTITRVALTNSTDKGGVSVGEDGEEKAGSGQMGRKHSVPYGLYASHIYISPFLASDTGFRNIDLVALLESLVHLFDHDRSASRGEMTTREVIVFEHELPLGNAPAHKVLETVRVKKIDDDKPARQYSDYKLDAPENGTQAVPGVTCYRLI